MTLTLTPGAVTLAELETLWRTGAAARLIPAARSAVEASAAVVARAAAGDAGVYGVNTGFGKLASVRIAPGDTARLQRNLILSHCAGVGEPVDGGIVRLMMALKLVSLGRGASGVRWDIIALLEGMLAAGVTPVIPAQGSVGASGDLAPLAHMAAVMIGAGEAVLGQTRLPGAAALAQAGLTPVVLGPKEGLALINGTQFSTALALAGLFEAFAAANAAVVTSAMSTDAIMGSTAPLRPEIHALRAQPGQIAVAAAMRALLAGSAIRDSHRTGDTRVQDPYCIRCQPQVTGAAVDLLRQAAVTLRIEANAVTDNPLVLPDGSIVSGGNFHAEPVAFAADQIALALAEIGAIAQRRVALMVDPTLSHDLPPFLTPAPGLNSAQSDQFVIGNSFFRTNWTVAPASATARDGLGPLLNANSCGGCHLRDGRGAPPDGTALNGLLLRLSVPGQTPEGAPLPDLNYGGQFNQTSIPGVLSEGKATVSYTELAGKYADGTPYSLRKPTYQFQELGYGPMQSGTMVSPRVGPQLPGVGLLEAIPDAVILALADPDDANKDGISGRPNHVWNYATKQNVLGRFGWKANQPNLHQQAASAFTGDMGITNSLFSTEELTVAQQKLYGQLPNGGSPELTDNNLTNVILYLQTLAVPARRNADDQTVLRGKQLFRQLNCSGCHVAKMQTGSHPVDVLANQTIRPYTDLLLHDMGDGLADNRPDFEATGTEWRTTPLWGIGLIKLVNRHTFLLHDGRARNVEEAILWHGGEAQKATDGFRTLPKTDRDALLKFVDSL